ncbi:hypothetical protein Clopa_3036 [Clostridium pasteurianum BC1]|uniref:Uncharacterized protein n=2 Tax=Clostridium pasteurianum TaxID=1501 RepID=R4KBE6_CLOPA|nr:hypothetical protein Clopa_3036 [Clostridium pasteurianum BC1]
MKLKQSIMKIIIGICAILIFIIGFTKAGTVMAAENSSLPALVCVDTPKNNDKIKGNVIDIAGWSLNQSGVKQVQVSVDNGNAQSAETGLSRLDVDRIYSAYKSANSGYDYRLDISSLSLGAHKITVTSTGNNGAVATQDLTVYKVPEDGRDKTPLMSIDNPNDSTLLNDTTNSITVNGWSLNGYGVQKVQVYFDDVEKDATIGQARVDVNNIFPGYTGGLNSGYSCTIDIPKIPDGIHKVKVVSIGNDGSTISQSIDVKKVSEQSMPGMLAVDTPRNNDKIKGNVIDIAGWSLNQSGVKQVQVSVDNGNAQSAETGLSRLDVDRIYSAYKSANSGYDYRLDISSLSLGAHKITVTSTGNNGAVATQDLTVYKVPEDGRDKTPLMSIDNPNDSTLLNDTTNSVTVNGWSLNGYGVQKVQVYFDGMEKDAEIGQARADVDKTFPGYTGGLNSGYSCTIYIPKISDGIHTVRVVSMGNDGSTISQSVNVKKVFAQSMTGLVTIDTPKYVQTNSGELDVAGWSLDLYGVKQVQVSLDNGTEQDAVIGVSRPDVAKQFLGYANEDSSGFNCNLDISSLSPGAHTLKVTSIGENGTSATSSTKIYVLSNGQGSLPDRLCVDTPKNNLGIKAQNYLFDVSGWALNAFGIQKVQIYVDNQNYGDAQLGISRPDVNNIYPGYSGGVQSGYKYTLNISSLSYGAHIITVKSIGDDNSVTSKDVVIYKVPDNTDSASKLVSFLSTGNNVQQTETEAVKLHDGNQSNNCVYFSSTALRSIGINVPIWMENTKHYVPYITSLGWTRTSDVNQLYPGNIVFTVPDSTGYPSHTYVFMGWVDPNDHTKAYVADNQADIIHIRSMIDAPGIDAYAFSFFN